MAITSRQIGWSQESNILWSISKQLEQIARLGGGGGGSITGGGANGQIAFWDAATNITGSNNLFWDNINKRMGIGTNTPLTTAAGYTVLALNGGVGAGGVLEFQSNGTRIATINNNNLQLDLETKIAGPITFGTNGSERMRIDSVGNVGIGTNNPLYRLHIVSATSLDAVYNCTLATGNTTIYIDNDLGRGLRINTWGSTATGTLIDGTINRASTTAIRTNSTSNTIVFGGLNNSASFVYFGNTTFTLSLDNSTSNVSIGTSAFAGYKLDVAGTGRFQSNVLIKGSTSDATANALTVQNSSSTNLLRVRNNGTINMSLLPTSATGLVAGDLWNNGGVVNIV